MKFLKEESINLEFNQIDLENNNNKTTIEDSKDDNKEINDIANLTTDNINVDLW